MKGNIRRTFWRPRIIRPIIGNELPEIPTDPELPILPTGYTFIVEDNAYVLENDFYLIESNLGYTTQQIQYLGEPVTLSGQIITINY